MKPIVTILLPLWIEEYVPESAAAVLGGLRGLDENSWQVTIQLYAMDAEVETERQNN